MHKKFLCHYFWFLCGFSLLLFCNYLYLRNLDEFTPVDQVLDMQMQSDGLCIYGPAVQGIGYFYKLEGYKRKKPEVLVLGSSRVMQFREAFFVPSFYNAGGAMDSLANGAFFLEDIFASHKPEVILLGIDFWWFNDRYQDAVAPYPTMADTSVTFQSLFLPFEWFVQRKIGLTDYLVTLFEPFSKKSDCMVGARAQARKSGYGQDGSHYYTDDITGMKPSSDEGFAYTFDLIHGGKKHFAYTEKAARTHIRVLQGMISRMESHGIDVVVFFSPMPKSVNQMLSESGKYQYVSDLKKQLFELGIEYFDFQDPDSVGTTTCEFIDGFHTGDVGDARLLQALYRTDPERFSFIDIEAVARIVEDNAGLAMVRDERITDQPEVDFLKLGCDKSSSTER